MTSARRRVLMLLSLLGIPALALLGLPTPAGADADLVVASYQMDEGGGTTLVDSSGNGLNGTSGSSVAKNGSFHDYPAPSSTPNPNRLDTVPSNSQLNPGTREFRVDIRARTTGSSVNLLQKGQAGTSGGFYKLEYNSAGRINCVFFDSTGASAGAQSSGPLNDGEWHTIRCERRSDEIVIYVDGAYNNRNVKSIGSVANSDPVSIGGKYFCNGVEVGCDYFSGEVDFAVFRTESTPPPVNLPTGSYDSIEVDGQRVIVRGRASDPEGAPTYRVTIVREDGTLIRFFRTATPPTFATNYSGVTGEQNVCISLLDNPTGQTVGLGCKRVTVK